MDVVVMFERAAASAASMAERVGPEQVTLPTPCAEWDVAALLDHMAGGPAYLMGALQADASAVAGRPSLDAVAACVAELSVPGALDRRCLSPAGFEWSIAEAAAGTAMDQLVHTWDLAVAIGEDRTVDETVAAELLAMFVPAMPDLGRQAGFVGPAVAVPASASASDRLLGAMGRDPAR